MATHSERKMLARAGPILKRLPAGRPVMVEVGVFKAQMAVYLLSKRPELTWHGVDNWLPRDRQPESYIKTEDIHAVSTPEQQARWRAEAMGALMPFARAIVHEQASTEAAATFDDASVDLVFIDADHSYDGCMSDLKAWRHTVKPGGWLSGHDYGNPDPRFRYGVDRAVKEFAAETGLQLQLDGGHTYFFRIP